MKSKKGGARAGSGRKPTDKKPVTKRLSLAARDHLELLSRQVGGDQTHAMEQCILQTKKIKPKD